MYYKIKQDVFTFIFFLCFMLFHLVHNIYYSHKTIHYWWQCLFSSRSQILFLFGSKRNIYWTFGTTILFAFFKWLREERINLSFYTEYVSFETIFLKPKKVQNIWWNMCKSLKNQKTKLAHNCFFLWILIRYEERMQQVFWHCNSLIHFIVFKDLIF